MGTSDGDIVPSALITTIGKSAINFDELLY